MCDINELHRLTDSGLTLTIEEKAGLEIAMLKRANEEGFNKLFFWGKIIGSKDKDYLIAYGIQRSFDYPTKKFFFCTSRSFELQQLPALNDDFTAKAEACTGMFAGDPTLILDMEEKPEPAEGEVAPEVFSEIHRLTWTIGNIDRDTAIVPRGAFIVAPSHEVIKNKGYEGLDFEAAGKLESFFHFRKAELLETQSALEKQGLVRGTDFLDPVSSDSPAGCWSLQYNASKTSTTMRSLIWPGYFFFHAIETSCYGGAYIGYGQKNCDIAFMM